MRINSSDSAIEHVPEGTVAGNIVSHGAQPGILIDALPPEWQSAVKTLQPYVEMLFGALVGQDKPASVKGYPPADGCAASSPAAHAARTSPADESAKTPPKKKKAAEEPKTKAASHSNAEPQTKELAKSKPKPKTENKAHSAKADAPESEPSTEAKVKKPALDEFSQRELDKAKKDRDFLSQFENGDFDLIESRYGGFLGGGKNDGKLSRGDLEAAAKDDSLPAATRELAKQMVNDPRLFNVMDVNNDGLVTRDEILALRKTTDAKIVRLEGTTTKALGETGGAEGTTGTTGAAGTAGTAGTGGTASGDATGGSTGASTGTGESHTLPPTSLPGLPGAMDRVGKGIDAIMGELGDLPNKGLSEAEMNRQSTLLNQRLQALINLQQNMMTMVSNLAKMYAEISSNAIRNMK